LLEGRCVPSTVTNLNDAGAGSLRQAILDTSAGGTVDFQPGLSGTITLTTGELAITKDLTIAGPGADVITVSGNHGSRVFEITASVTVALSGLTMADGFPGTGQSGGGIFNHGRLTVTDSTVSGNQSDYAGGGIYNIGGTLSVTSSTLSGNTAGTSGGGIFNYGGTATVTASTLSGNSAPIAGGGLCNAGSGTVTVTASTLSGNSGGDDGGGILNDPTAKVTVTASTLSGNSAQHGGGIDNARTLTVTNCALSGNSASTSGGGVYNTGGTLTITDSTLSGNSAGAGGGIYNSFSTLTLTSSTLSSNSATTGGGIDNVGVSGPATVTLTSSTLSGNSATTGGGIDNVGLLAVTRSRNTILAGNTAPGSPDISGPLNSQGHNLIGDGTGGSGFDPTDLVGTAGKPIDPKLGPLQDNSGPTETMALLLGSPAIDAGDNTDAPPTDQRGAPRIFNGVIDIGAYEVQAAPWPSAAVSESLLWPADSSMVNVGLAVPLNDDADPSTHRSVQVYGNDNANAADAAAIAPGTLQLRAYRQGHGSGRVYLIVATATDASGQTGFDVCTVVVPHDQSGGSIAQVQAEAAAAEAYYREFQTAPAGYALLGEGQSSAGGHGAPAALVAVADFGPAFTNANESPVVRGSTVPAAVRSGAPASLDVPPDHPPVAEAVRPARPLWDGRHAQDAVFAAWDRVPDGLALSWR
jgi:hypothetical protein